MNTGENARFVRNWWEVDRARSHYEAESTAAAHASGCKWFPYNKGGTFRKWYGNQQSVVAFDAENYDILSNQGNHLPSRPVLLSSRRFVVEGSGFLSFVPLLPAGVRI